AFECWTEVDRLELLLSRFIASGEIYQINAAPGEWIRISADTLRCLQLAQRWHAQTAGAFDITLGTVIEARRGDDGLIQEAPQEQGTVLSAMDALEIDDESFAARLNDADAMLDLGAIGKGYALDSLVETLQMWSVENALLYAGQSSVLAIGDAPQSEGWAVDLRHPDANPLQPGRESGDKSASQHENMSESDRDCPSVGKVLLHNRALSGSGRTLHGWHIIDPRSGQSARTRATWATAASAARSDAISTAFMAMSIEEVEVFCQTHRDVAALLVTSDNQWLSFGDSEFVLNNPII
ncbi:MAG: FAD:protein transferase, partial [Abditibacteriota bacterium]|nr:FAD:protein transferase [Abditibacteriota bacterium]